MMKSLTEIKKINISKEALSILVIILLGAFLRLYRIKDYIVFLGDEGRDALVVYNILHGDLTLLGPTSSVGGFFLGPIYYYLMAPFLWLFRYDPVGPAVMVALLGLATIYLVYLIGKEFFGIKAGLIASLLYAISPLVIVYSRSSWNPNVFPFFTILSLFLLYKAVVKNKWWIFIISGFLMGINLQIHYLATFVGAIMFFYVFFVDFKPKISWLKLTIKRYLLMFVGFLIGFSPFLMFEVRHQFTNSQNIFNFIFNSNDTGTGSLLFFNIQHVFTRVFGGLVIAFPSFKHFTEYSSSVLNIWLFASVILGLIASIFFIYLFIKNYKNKEEYRKYLLILVWGLAGIGLFGFYQKSIYDYYLAFLFPLPFLLIGLLLSSFWDKFKNIGKIITIILVVILFLLNLKFTPAATPGNHQADQMKEISMFVLGKTGDEPFNFALSGAGNSDHAYRYFFKLARIEPVTILGIGQDPDRKSVTKQLFVICEAQPCSPLGESSNEIAGFGRGEIADEWNVSFVKVYRIVHYTGNE